MDQHYFKMSLKWGVFQWLFGYILGFIAYFFLPVSLLGWAVLPFAMIFTLWILIKKITLESLSMYLLLGLIWMIIAIILDYVLVVKLLNPVDGYYKLDVYLYYGFTLILPLIVGQYKLSKRG